MKKVEPLYPKIPVEYTFCVHCKERVVAHMCDRCGGKTIQGSCRDCHMELVHNQIQNQNIMFFNGAGWECLSPAQREKFHG